MQFLDELFSNYVLNASLAAWFIAQLIKTIITLVFTKKLVLERMIGAGGMPSAHSATVCALTVSMSRAAGISSPEFALAVLFATVVMYDAMGVRRAAGEHAKVINAMLDDWDEQIEEITGKMKNKNKEKDIDNKEKTEKKEVKKGKKEKTNKNARKETYKHVNIKDKDIDLDNVELKEYLGHTPLEVFAGALLGIVVALIVPK